MEFLIQRQGPEQEILFQENCQIILQCPNLIEIKLEDGSICQELCLNIDLRTRGRDKKHSALPLVLQCSKCLKKFYPHTSYQFQELAEDKARKFLDAVFTDHQSLKTLSKEFNISESRLSQFASDFKKIIVSEGIQNILGIVQDSDKGIISPNGFLYHS